MIAFKVSLNGQHVCTAGVRDFGVLSAIVTWVRRQPAAGRGAKRIEEELSVEIGGLDSGANEQLRWLAKRLRVGDSIAIEVVEADAVDRPARRERDDRRKIARARRSKPMDFDAVREIGMRLHDVEESSMYGAPALKVRGRLLTCPAIHPSAEPNSLIVSIGFEQRDELMREEPGIYYVTPHYVNYPSVLVRLPRIHQDALRGLLVMAHQFVSARSTTRASRIRKRH